MSFHEVRHAALHAPGAIVRVAVGTRFRGALASILLGFTALGLAASTLAGQSAQVVQEENFRNEPNGGLLAVLGPGVELAFHDRRENWVEATMEGWVWAQSLLTTDRGGYDLIVSTGEGENLRDRPSGEILGKLEDGTFLEEIERIPGWIRVRRRGWIWGPSVEVDEAAPTPAAEVELVPVTDSPPASAPTESDAASSAVPTSRPSATTVAGPRSLLDVPGGDTLAVVPEGTPFEVVEQEDGWARIRVEGWIRVEDGETAESVGPLGWDAVVEDPDRSAGRTVRWELQFIRLERAESFRTDFEDGEPYLLTRTAGPSEGGFVYVTVPPALLTEAEGLVPLETITVVGRIRTGRSALMGRPVVELSEFVGR